MIQSPLPKVMQTGTQRTNQTIIINGRKPIGGITVRNMRKFANKEIANCTLAGLNFVVVRGSINTWENF